MPEVCGAVVSEDARVEPSPENTAVYRRGHQVYQSLSGVAAVIQPDVSSPVEFVPCALVKVSSRDGAPLPCGRDLEAWRCVVILLLAGSVSSDNSAVSLPIEMVREVQNSAILIDTHNDVTSRTVKGFDIGKRAGRTHRRSATA